MGTVPKILMDNRFSSLINHPEQELVIEGVKLVVRDGVFTPDPIMSHSSSLIASHLPDVRDKVVLDLGCGSGVIGILAARRGARSVICADIHPLAVQNTRENVSRNLVEDSVMVRESNLFEKVPERFDYIFANLPISSELWLGESPEKIFNRFADELPKHLNEGGEAHLVWGSFEPMLPIREMFSRFNVEEIIETGLGYEWHLFSFTLK